MTRCNTEDCSVDLAKLSIAADIRQDVFAEATLAGHDNAGRLESINRLYSEKNWDELLSDPINGPRALHSLAKGQISESACWTILTYLAAYEEFSEVWAKAKYYNLKAKTEDKEFFLDSFGGVDRAVLTKRLDAFLTNVSEPEQGFFYVPTDVTLEQIRDGKKLLANSTHPLAEVFTPFSIILSNLPAPLNIQFYRVNEEGKVAFLVPSFSLMQAALNIIFEENAVALKPRFDEISDEALRTMVEVNDWPQTISCYGIREPDAPADNRFAKKISRIWHDFGHAFLMSSVFNTSKKEIFKIYDLFKENEAALLVSMKKFFDIGDDEVARTKQLKQAFNYCLDFDFNFSNQKLGNHPKNKGAGINTEQFIAAGGELSVYEYSNALLVIAMNFLFVNNKAEVEKALNPTRFNKILPLVKNAGQIVLDHYKRHGQSFNALASNSE